MIKFDLYTITFFSLVFLASYAPGQILLEENFDYPAGDTLSNHNWVQARNGDPVTVHNQGLVYTGYNLSDIGNAARLHSEGSQEVKRSFSEVSADSLYISFLVNINNADSLSLTGGLFLYLTPPNGSIFSPRATVCVRKNEANQVSFGISIGSGSRFTNYDYALNTTYLLVMKYKFNPDTTNTLSFWVNPDLSLPEQSALLFDDTGQDLPSIAEIFISQLVLSNAPPDAILDGIKIATGWPVYTALGKSDFSNPVSRFELAQNYPNPFNPTTQISFQIHHPAYVSLKIYNANGQFVQTLLNEYQSVNHYKIKFDASHLPTGMYFYQLNAGNFSQTKRMLFIK